MSSKAISSFTYIPLVSQKTEDFLDHQLVKEMTDEGIFHYDLYKKMDGSLQVTIGTVISRSPGFGTQACRRMCAAIIAQGFGNHKNDVIHATAAMSSLVFHLKMGMQPLDSQEDLLTVHTSKDPEKQPRFFNPETCTLLTEQEAKPIIAAQKQRIFLETIARLTAGSDLSEEDEKRVKDYKVKLTLPESLLDEKVADQMTNEELVLRQDELLRKKVSMLHVHICRLIKAIQETPGSQRPNTSHFKNIQMSMPEAGIARWKSDIEKVEPFQSFHKFEQLHDSLTPELKELLCSTLSEARARGVLI
jgi:hypothetical protein